MLTHLKSLPVNTLKIDKSFVRDLGFDPDDLSIVRAIIGLADAFNLGLVAEGVETVLAARTLLEHGCYRAQGSCFRGRCPGMRWPSCLPKALCRWTFKPFTSKPEHSQSSVGKHLQRSRIERGQTISATRPGQNAQPYDPPMPPVKAAPPEPACTGQSSAEGVGAVFNATHSSARTR